MVKLRVSGSELIKVLYKFGFKKKSQKGSHVKLIKQTTFGKVVCIVPLHKEIKPKTLRRIIKQTKIPMDEILRYL